MSDDLVEWLRARLAADERVAQLVAERYTERGPYAEHPGKPYWPQPSVVARFRDADEGIAAGLTLIETYSPARVLREVEALRKILARHEPIEVFGQILCTYCGVTKGASRPDASWPCPDLRDLAEIFSDRPGYREEWRPA